MYVASYLASYVASPSTLPIALSQPANVYLYISSAALVGVAPVYVGVTPYSTSFSSNILPSQFTNVIVYLFFVAVYVAVYVAFPLTFVISLSQVANLYVYSTVAAFVGSDGTATVSP